MVIELLNYEVTLKDLEEMKKKFRIEILNDSILIFL